MDISFEYSGISMIKSSQMSQVRTRFAPSPTGSMHIGGLRTALYAYALAKNQKGDFILRIEDTDKEREVSGAKEAIYKILKDFGLIWDEKYIQSERVKMGIYKKAAEKLVSEGHAFYCQCKAKNAKKEGFSKDLRDPCRDKELTSGAVKLKVPKNEKISFTDFVLRKEVSWDTSTVADTTLLKSDGFPTYHLAVVVDDNDMRISHVLRGHDWLPSTSIHLLVYKYLGYEVPQIGHLTDILNPEGGKLSKRKGSVSCESFLAEGYLPKAILNFVMLLGWAPKDNRELFSLEEFVANFDKGELQIANPIFNRQKLDWFNGIYIRKKSDKELLQLIKQYLKDSTLIDQSAKNATLINQTIPLIKTRITKLSDYWPLCSFFFEEPKLEKGMFQTKDFLFLEKSLIALIALKSWTEESIERTLHDLIAKKGWKTGQFFMAFRIALTGSQITPPITDSAAILGQKTTLSRLQKALEMLK